MHMNPLYRNPGSVSAMLNIKRVRVIDLGQNIYLHPHFLHTGSEDSSESVHLRKPSLLYTEISTKF